MSYKFKYFFQLLVLVLLIQMKIPLMAWLIIIESSFDNMSDTLRVEIEAAIANDSWDNYSYMNVYLMRELEGDGDGDPGTPDVCATGGIAAITELING